jgi:hypothetical protein
MNVVKIAVGVTVCAVAALYLLAFPIVDRNYKVEMGTGFGYIEAAPIKGDGCVVPRMGIAEPVDTSGPLVRLAYRVPTPEEGCEFYESRSWIKKQLNDKQIQREVTQFLHDLILDEQRKLYPSHVGGRVT